MLSYLLKEHYPDELLNLYNPAYTAAIVFVAGAEYERKKANVFPFLYSYVTVAFVAADDTRLRLPARATGRMSDWAQANADVLIEFPLRTVSLKPFVDSGLTFLGTQGLMEFALGGCTFKNLKSLTAKLAKAQLQSPEVEAELKAAALLGRWLAGEDDVATVLAFLGIKP